MIQPPGQYLYSIYIFVIILTIGTLWFFFLFIYYSFIFYLFISPCLLMENNLSFVVISAVFSCYNCREGIQCNERIGFYWYCMLSTDIAWRFSVCKRSLISLWLLLSETVLLHYAMHSAAYKVLIWSVTILIFKNVMHFKILLRAFDTMKQIITASLFGFCVFPLRPR